MGEGEREKANDSHRKSIIIYLHGVNWFFLVFSWENFLCSISSYILFADFNFNFQFKSFPIKFHSLCESEKCMENTVDTWLDSGKLAIFSLFVWFRLVFGSGPKTLILIGLKIK